MFRVACGVYALLSLPLWSQRCSRSGQRTQVSHVYGRGNAFSAPPLWNRNAFASIPTISLALFRSVRWEDLFVASEPLPLDAPLRINQEEGARATCRSCVRIRFPSYRPCPEGRACS